MKVRHTWAIALPLAAAAALTVTSCGQEAQMTSNGSTIVFHQQQEPDALNPIISEMVATTDAVTPILEGLTIVDDQLRFEPVLAETIPTAENGLVKTVGKGMTVTWPLRKNVRWHDGKPFTAADVEFTFRAIMHPNTRAITRQGYDKIDRVEVVNDHTVKIHYKEVYAPHLNLFSTILPEHLLADAIVDLKGDSINRAAFNRKPVGTGPYKFKNWVSGDHISFEANNDYWRGKPKAAALKMRIVPDENAACTLL
jgi:peptide/nickel transport system substrate-binding protein